MAFLPSRRRRLREALGERLVAWLGADSALQDRTRAALVAAVRERWSWQGVARGVIAAELAENLSAGPLGRVDALMYGVGLHRGLSAHSVGALRKESACCSCSPAVAMR